MAIPYETFLLKILGWTIPFFLGLFASLIIDKMRSVKTKSRNEKFIKFYLSETILKNLPKLKTDYLSIKDKIKTYKQTDDITVSAHEDFNTNVLNGLTSVQYYEVFNEKFVLVNEIITMIEYMSQFLPSNLHSEFYADINCHLKEKNDIGNLEHVHTCDFCRQKQQEFISVLSSRIKESDILKEKIEELIK